LYEDIAVYILPDLFSYYGAVFFCVTVIYGILSMSNIEILTEQFIRYMQTEKRSSEHTLRAYKNDISDFFECVFDKDTTVDINEINTQIVRRWVSEMIKNGLNPRSVNRKTAALNSFFRYLMRKKTISCNPATGITKPKISKRLPAFIPEEKLEVALDYLQPMDQDNYLLLRDSVILETFYATGMRISELVNLKHGDIDFYLQQIKVLGKRNKERIIPMTENIRQILKEYISRKNMFFPNPDNYFLFLTTQGKPVSI
jgi:integrase/recombinase XerC